MEKSVSELKYNNYARFAIHENGRGHKYICDMWKFILEKNTFPCSMQLCIHPESLDEMGFTKDRLFYRFTNQVLQYVKNQDKNNNEKLINAYTNTNGSYIIIPENFWFIFKLKIEETHPFFEFENSNDVDEGNKRIIYLLKNFTQENELLQFIVNYVVEDIFKNTLIKSKKDKDVELNSEDRDIIRPYLIAYRQLVFIITKFFTIIPYNKILAKVIHQINEATKIYSDYKITQKDFELLKSIYSSIVVSEILNDKIYTIIKQILIRRTGWKKKTIIIN